MKKKYLTISSSQSNQSAKVTQIAYVETSLNKWSALFKISTRYMEVIPF